MCAVFRKPFLTAYNIVRCDSQNRLGLMNSKDSFGGLKKNSSLLAQMRMFKIQRIQMLRSKG